MKTIGYSFAICWIGFIVFSCSNKDQVNGLEKQLSFNQTKLVLANSKDQNNAILKIDLSASTTQVTFEDGEIISFDKDKIDRIENDSTNWTSNFYFTDKTNVSAYFIGKLNLTKENIILNPYEKNPLTALAKIETPIKGLFKVIVSGKGTDGVSIGKSFNDYGYAHELPILGLYQNYLNQVQFVFTNQNGQVRTSQTLSLQTDPIPTNPTILIKTNKLGSDYNGIYFISSLRLGFDQMGEVRWCSTPESSSQFSFMRKMANGNMLLVSPDSYSFTELTMIGQTIKKYSVPNGIHHDIIELPNGNLLVASNSNNGASIEDLVVELDRASGSIVKSWDLNKILDPKRKALPDTGSTDWFHMNSLFYDATDKSIIISGRAQSAVVKIDYASGNLKWIIGNPNFWNDSFSSYLFTPVDASGAKIDVSGQDFWQYGQHAAERLQNGNILMYDDGDYRNYYDNQNVPQTSYSRAVEYSIDEQAKTIKLVWEFNNKKSQFTPYTGYVQDLSNANRIIAYMGGAFAVGATGPKIVEINKNNQILFDADINVGAFYYRGYKLDLYEGIK